jgi:hypothetical protein
MAGICIRLEACDPARGHFRGYRIEAGVDLRGDWLVDVTESGPSRLRRVSKPSTDASLTRRQDPTWPAGRGAAMLCRRLTGASRARRQCGRFATQ